MDYGLLAVLQMNVLLQQAAKVFLMTTPLSHPKQIKN